MQKYLKPEQSTEQENTGLPRLSRSPHPYSRRSFRLDSPAISEQDRRDGINIHVLRGGIIDDKIEDDDDKQYQSQYIHRPSPDTASSSDSEEEHLLQLKALPPPSTKPSKGLRIPPQDAGSHDITPLLTPNALHEAQGRLAKGYFDSANGSSISQDELDKLKQRFETKRRLSLIHRGCEVVLLAVITVVVLSGGGVWSHARRWSKSLLTALSISAALFVSYPVRLAMVSIIKRGKIDERLPQIPASFDPAPALYPPLLPILVALSIAPGNPDAVPLNLVLGLASLPAQLVPQIDSDELVDPVHWALVTLLLSAFNGDLAIPSQSLSSAVPSTETMALLFPLHRNLLAVITSLTTTSLLSSEAQLLSVAFINLLILAEAPQARILSIVLWTGGLSLLVFCSHVVEWNVALERVPVQQLQRAARALSTGGRSFVTTLADSLSQGQDNLGLDSAGLDKTISYTELSNGTSSNDILTKPTRPSLRSLRTNTRERSSSFKTRTVLTAQGIETRKWAYALWTYCITIATILLPIRYLVQQALNQHEPFGWAIGYLFGDISYIRDYTAIHNLQSWIIFPTPRITTAASLLTSTPTPTLRLLLIAHAILTLALGITTVIVLTPYLYIDTRRKIFHFTMVVLLLPTLPLDPCFFALALSLILALFLLLDFVRAGQLRPLSKPLARFLTPYVDGRDLRGPVVVSHIFLLIGCAIPLWLSLASTQRGGTGAWEGWEVKRESGTAGGDISMLAGVVCVGMGDAAASLVGRRFGRRKWMWGGGKSLEGSAAFAVAVVLGLTVGKVWMHQVESWRGGGRGHEAEQVGMWEIVDTLVRMIVAATGASFMEAVLTGCNDNVVVPVVLWLLVRGLRL